MWDGGINRREWLEENWDVLPYWLDIEELIHVDWLRGIKSPKIAIHGYVEGFLMLIDGVKKIIVCRPLLFDYMPMRHECIKYLINKDVVTIMFP